MSKNSVTISDSPSANGHFITLRLAASIAKEQSETFKNYAKFQRAYV